MEATKMISPSPLRICRSFIYILFIFLRYRNTYLIGSCRRRDGSKEDDLSVTVAYPWEFYLYLFIFLRYRNTSLAAAFLVYAGSG